MEDKLTTFIVQENTETVNKGIIAVRLLNQGLTEKALKLLGYEYKDKDNQYTYYISKEQYQTLKESVLNETKSSSI